MRRAALLLLLVGSIAAALYSWNALRRPNVVLITVDSLRPDYLSCYGRQRVATPRIDALANAGIVFTQAVTDVPWSRGAMASVMTGQYAFRHRVRSMYERLPDDAPTLAEAFRTGGYRTAAIVDSFDLDHIFRLGRGFDVYDDRCEEPVVGLNPRPLRLVSVYFGDMEQDRNWRRRKLRNNGMRSDERTTDAAVAWLRHIGGQSFFLWVHYFGARERWPDGVGAAELIAQYPERVAAADAAVGRLLQAIADFGLERQTLVVLHADHGRSLLEHGGVLLGGELYESSVHVPLIVRWPGALPAGHRVDTLVHLIDIFPTLADFAGLSTPRNLDGESLNGVIHGIGRRGAPEAYAETYVPATAPAGQETEVDGEQGGFGFVRRAIRTQRWKYIRSEPSTPLAQPESAAPPPELPRQSAREELYDLSRDPGETVNLIDQEPAVATALRGQLEQHGAAPTR